MLAGMDDNGVITVRDLRRRYGGTGGRGFDAVRGVTFSVRRGELFALLGTNGAGKTSTMEVLEGLAPPAHGAVRVLGCDPAGSGHWSGAGWGSCCRRAGSRRI
jgi:ABC-2 type transport system ATP-binding protein